MGNEAAIIRRRFADLAHGQMHYREAGDGAPLLLLHSSPGSSRQMVRMIGAFAEGWRVIAPDTPGNGDSEALGGGGHDIAQLAGAMLEFMDRLGIARAHVYGMHTGAAIAAELAVLAPGRVAALALEGLSLLDGEVLAEMLARYAAPFEPDSEGAYLARVFQFCRDQSLFFPWYDRSRAARRDGGLPPPADLDALVVEVLKAGRSYHHNYHAAFRWEARERLALVACPLRLMASEADPLFAPTRAIAGDDFRFQPLPRFDAAEFAAVRQQAMHELFNEADG